MWYRLERQGKSCPCGGVTEKWTLLGGGKYLAVVTFCPLCHPRMAALVGRPESPVPQDENTADNNEGGSETCGVSPASK